MELHPSPTTLGSPSPSAVSAGRGHMRFLNVRACPQGGGRSSHVAIARCRVVTVIVSLGSGSGIGMPNKVSISCGTVSSSKKV